MIEAIATPKNAHTWSREANDWYVEPAWTAARLFETPIFSRGMTILDPACGMGTIVESACLSGMTGLGADIVPRWEARPEVDRLGAYAVADFLSGQWPDTSERRALDAIVSNPPYKAAQQFAELALERSPIVALLLPTKWLQGDRRARWLRTTPLHRVLMLCPRPSMPPGHVILCGEKPGNGTVDFAWFCWFRGYQGEPQIGWLHRDGVTTHA